MRRVLLFLIVLSLLVITGSLISAEAKTQDRANLSLGTKQALDSNVNAISFVS